MAARRKAKKEFEKRFEEFGEEAGHLGKKFGNRMEQKGRGFEKRYYGTLGILGPIVSSIVGIIILAIAIWILGFISRESGIVFLAAIANFLLSYIGLLFVFSLFFSYTDYLSKIRPREFKPFSPIVNAAGIIVAFWIIAHLLLIANSSLAIPVLSEIGLFVLAQKYLIFVFFALVLYLAFIVGRPEEKEPEEKPMKTEKKEEFKRLYRSGKEKILGGVCGGIAEYFNIDPVIVRLLWVAFCFAGGAGILFYLIAWIIIPRNPEHEWN